MREFPGFRNGLLNPDYRTLHWLIFIHSKQKANIQNKKLFHFYYMENMYNFNMYEKNFIFNKQTLDYIFNKLVFYLHNKAKTAENKISKKKLVHGISTTTAVISRNSLLPRIRKF